MANQMGHARPHLHAGPLAAQRQPGTNRQDAAHKLHRDQGEWRWREFPFEHGLDMGNSTP